jgi:hypothetical protein
LDWACDCLHISDYRSDSQLRYSGKHDPHLTSVRRLTHLQYREAVEKMNSSNNTYSSLGTLWSGDVKVELS